MLKTAATAICDFWLPGPPGTASETSIFGNLSQWEIVVDIAQMSFLFVGLVSIVATVIAVKMSSGRARKELDPMLAVMLGTDEHSQVICQVSNLQSNAAATAVSVTVFFSTDQAPPLPSPFGTILPSGKTQQVVAPGNRPVNLEIASVRYHNSERRIFDAVVGDIALSWGTNGEPYVVSGALGSKARRPK